MSSLRLYCTRAVTLALLVTTALADTIVLKSGEKIEGNVIQETDQNLTLAVKVSATITDERVVARADVERIEKITADVEAYKALATIQTPSSSLAASQYETLTRPLEAFLKQYPASARAADVQTALSEILAEKKRVESGELKLRGQWLPKAEVEKERIQISGLLALEHMKNQSAAGDAIGAMNTFATIEKNYAGAASMPESITLAGQVMASLKQSVERAMPEQKAFEAEKKAAFASVGAAQRAEMIAAHKSDMAEMDATVTAAEAAGQWPPLLASNEKSLKTLMTRLGRETSRIARLPVDKMKASLQFTQTAKQKIAAGDSDAAANALKDATKLWPANELAVRLTKEVAATLKASPPKEKAAAPEAAAATPKAATSPKPSAAGQQAVVPVAAAPVEARPFYLTLPGAIGIVVAIAAVLAGVNVFQKMRARRNASVE